MSFDFYPPEVVCRFLGMRESQIGYFYDDKLKTLIVGRIKDGKLKGRVIHNGRTQKDFDEGRYFSAWSMGYSYSDWDKHDFIYVGKKINYTSLKGYFKFIDQANLESIKAYFKAKELLKDINQI